MPTHKLSLDELTLTIDPAVSAAAKVYAEEHGTSVSKLVEAYLSVLAGRATQDETPPVLKRLRGSLKGVEVEEVKASLEEKYR